MKRKSGVRRATQRSNGNSPLYNMGRRIICAGFGYPVFLQKNDHGRHRLKKLADEQSFVPFYRFVFLLIGPGGKQVDGLFHLILLRLVVPLVIAGIPDRNTGQPGAQNRVVRKAQGGQNNHQDRYQFSY